MTTEKIRKVIINTCYGGFGLSDKAKTMYNLLSNTPEEVYDTNIPRDDPILIKVIETIGLQDSSGQFAELKIVEIPYDVNWELGEYDGIEWIAEAHRTWG